MTLSALNPTSHTEVNLKISGARELVHRRGVTRIHVSTQVLDMGQISQEMQNMGISGLETGHKLLTNICRISTKTYFSFKSPYTSPKFVEFKFGENNNKKNFKVTNTWKLQALSWNIFYKNSIKFHYYVIIGNSEYYFSNWCLEQQNPFWATMWLFGLKHKAEFLFLCLLYHLIFTWCGQNN